MSTEHKAVLLSIRPEWCVKILNGEKTVEIRKNRPKLKPPFKCYIYCTKAQKKLITIFRDGDVFGDGEVYRGKPQFVTWDGGNIPIEIRQKEQTVIAEFVCDKIRPIIGKTWIVKEDIERATSGSCLSLKQIIEYAGWSHCSSFTERKELYLANREYYAERSKEQSTRRKQSRLEELLAGEPRPFKPPKYTIEQVNNRAIALGISYGWCSYLLSVGKVCME